MSATLDEILAAVLKSQVTEVDVTRYDPTGALRPENRWGTRDPGPWPKR